MQKENVQMSLLDTCKSVEEQLENNKPELFKLLDEHLDWDNTIPESFTLAFLQTLWMKQSIRLGEFPAGFVFAVVDITRLEKEIQKAVNEIGCNLLRDALEKYDHDLMINRDTEEYRHRGKKQTVLKTVMDEVSYRRVSYEYTDEQGRNARIFLHDKALGQAVTGKLAICWQKR